MHPQPYICMHMLTCTKILKSMSCFCSAHSGAGFVLSTKPSSGQHVPRDLEKWCCTLMSDGEGLRGRTGGRVPPPPCHRCPETGVQPPQTGCTQSAESLSEHDGLRWCRKHQWWGKMLWFVVLSSSLFLFCDFYHKVLLFSLSIILTFSDDNLKQNKAQSTCGESTNKGVN